FALAALPLLVLRGPMPAPFGRILLIGVLLGVVKFGLLFVGMAQGMPAGLSSLVLQSQVFFTILIAALWLGERPSPRGLFGLSLAAAGLVLIGLERP
ncbi:EamA family transporter, partial [Pseudomonas aeruginosa]|nr:EamA family transporter [Pseudomonas aeruginosa]